MGAKITQALFYGHEKIGGIIAVWCFVPIYRSRSRSVMPGYWTQYHLPTSIVKQSRLEIYKPKGQWLKWLIQALC